MLVPIDQRKWKDIPAVDYVNKRSVSYRVPKTMARILRHQGFDREDDGAMDWNTLLPLFCRDSENASEWADAGMVRSFSYRKRHGKIPVLCEF